MDERAPSPSHCCAMGPSLSRGGERGLTALHVPRTASDDGVIDAAKAALGDALLEVEGACRRDHADGKARGDRQRSQGAARHAWARISAADGDCGGRLSRPAGAVRGRLSTALADQEPAHAGQGLDRRGDAGADRDDAVAERRLARARGVRHVRRHLRRQPGPEADPHRLRLRGLPAAQGLPAHRPCRAALFRGGEARGL